MPGDDSPTPEDIAREERKARLRSRVFTLADLLEQETPHAEALLGPLIRRGMRTLIGGYGGHGKSTISMEMVKACVTGGEFLGYEGCGEKALIIDLEQGMSVAQRNVYQSFTGKEAKHGESVRDLAAGMSFGDHMHACLYCDWQEGVNLTQGTPDIEVVEELIDAERPDIVLVDPVYKLFLGANVNEQEVISAFIKAIDDLRAKYGFAVLLPMHPRKPMQGTGNRLTMHDLYGNAIWSWWAETVILVQRTTGNGTIMRFDKDRLGEMQAGEEWTLTYAPGKGFTRVLKGGEDPGTLPAHEKVWRLLQEMNGELLSREDIQKMLGMPRPTVIKATSHLKQINELHGEYDGLVITTGTNRGNLYAYRPSSEKLVMKKIVEEFGASEEEW